MSFSGDVWLRLDHHIGSKFDFSGLKDVFVSDEFEGRHSFDFDGNAIDVIETKPAHSLSDSVVFIRNKGVGHIGDIIAGDRTMIGVTGLSDPGFLIGMEIVAVVAD